MKGDGRNANDIVLTEPEAVLLVATVAAAVVVLPDSEERRKLAALYAKLSAQTGITIGD